MNSCICCTYGIGEKCGACESCTFYHECEYIYFWGRNSKQHLEARDRFVNQDATEIDEQNKAKLMGWV